MKFLPFLKYTNLYKKKKKTLILLRVDIKMISKFLRGIQGYTNKPAYTFQVE